MFFVTGVLFASKDYNNTVGWYALYVSKQIQQEKGMTTIYFVAGGLLMALLVVAEFRSRSNKRNDVHSAN